MAIITVSRGTYTGGQTVAQQLAERLGFECLSREELMEASTKSMAYLSRSSGTRWTNRLLFGSD